MLRCAHVAPRRPPGEEAVVVGIERAADVDEPAADDALEQRPLFRQLADRARLPFLRDARPGRCARRSDRRTGRAAVPASLQRARVVVERLEEAHLGGEVLAAVRHVDRRDGHGRPSVRR